MKKVGWYDCFSADFDHQGLIDSQYKGGIAGVCVCVGGITIATDILILCTEKHKQQKVGHMGDPPTAGLRGPLVPQTARYVTYSFCSTVWLPLLLEQRPVWECKQQGKL